MAAKRRTLPADLLTVSITDDLSIQYVRGALRKRAESVLEQHYTACAGNAGFLFAVVTASGEVLGGCLIGGTASEAQTRSLIAAPWPVRVIKRLWCDIIWRICQGGISMRSSQDQPVRIPLFVE